MRTSKILALILIILNSVTYFGCESKKTTKNHRTVKGPVSLGGSLTVPLGSLPTDLEPHALVGRVGNAVGVHVYEGLVRLDPQNSKVVAGLATSWSKESDGQSYVFNIRKGVQFHDSEHFGNASREVTAGDFVYSISLLAKESSDDFFRATVGGRIIGSEDYRTGDSEKLAGVEALDDYTLRIKLTKDDDSFLQILTMSALGVIPENSSDGGDSETIGAGPFILTDDEGAITLIRNSNYYREDEFGNNLPYIDTIRFVEIDQKSDQLQALFNDEIDIVSELALDPVRSILESHMPEFSGATPKFIMRREEDNASYDTYSIYRSTIKGMGSGFMGYRDYSQVQIEQ